MIERDFIIRKSKEFYIKKYVEGSLRGVGISQIRLKKIPLGEKILVHTNRPSLVVGSKGSNIRKLTKDLKEKFNLENPQIEIVEVKNVNLDAHLVADRIANSLERFGSNRFKGVGHRVMENVLESGALGVELILSGKIPGARAKSWRFYQGYLKKCGDVAFSGVRRAQKSALLKSGIIGIKVSIMPPDVVLPDHVEILSEPVQVIEEITPESSDKEAKASEKKQAEKKAEEPAKEAESKTKAPVKETPLAKEESEEKPEDVQEKEASETKETPLPVKVEDAVVDAAKSALDAVENVAEKVVDTVVEKVKGIMGAKK